MKYLAAILKQLSKNLKNLKLYLHTNNLEYNEKNLKHLSNGMKKIKNLQYLELSFHCNNLGENPENMKILGNCLK